MIPSAQKPEPSPPTLVGDRLRDFMRNRVLAACRGRNLETRDETAHRITRELMQLVIVPELDRIIAALIADGSLEEFQLCTSAPKRLRETRTRTETRVAHEMGQRLELQNLLAAKKRKQRNRRS